MILRSTISRFSMLVLKILASLFLLLEAIFSPVFAQSSGGLPPIRRSEPATISPEEAQALISQGWREFVGAQGIVNERRALDLTLRGINAIKEEAIKGLSTSLADDVRRTRSVGLNNLSVFERCAIDKRIRLSAENQTRETRQEYKDGFSIDNGIWDVYLRRTKISASDDEFIKYIREQKSSHPINRHITKLGNRLPESIDEAYRVLEEFAADGDAEASLRIAFRFECLEEPPQIQQSITWYERAISNYEKATSSQRRIDSARARLQRLRLIQSGKFRRD
jgi:hypothetical protein